MVITKIALPRRTFIRGMGATLALPLLDAMVPAMSAQAKAAPRFAAIYCGNGANMNDWTPATEGAGFAFSPILKPLEAFRDRTLVFTGLDNFPATDQGDSGGQHPRAAPAFMSCVHPKQTEGADVQAGTTIDQLIAQQICRDSKLSSLELAVDRNDVVGACDHGYACAYMNSMSWKTPTMPLPSETNPRFVFERLFGSGDTAEARVARSREDRSILDGVTQEIADLRRKLGARDGAKLSEYLDAIRDVEQRIARSESSQQRCCGAGAAGRRAGDVQGIRRADVRFTGAGVPGGHHARQFVHDGARERQSLVCRDWPARGAPLHVAPWQQSGQDGGVLETEYLSCRNTRLLPEKAAGDPRWRRDTPGSFDRALRQRDERRQHPQQLQRPGGGRGRARPADEGQSSPRPIRRARRWRICR